MNLKRMTGSMVFLSAALITAAETFSFVRPVKPSDSFRCLVQTRQSAQYSFSVPGTDQPQVKLNSLKADFDGYLTVRQVNASGSPERISLRADRFSGSINGRQIKTGLPRGAVIEGDLSRGKAEFFLDGKALGSELQFLFAHLFPPASDSSLADLTGKLRILPKPGGGWQPDLTAFIKMLGRRRIRLSPSSFRSGVTYHGSERIGKLSCRKFSILIETMKLADYDCRFKFSFSLAPSGPPVRSVRDVTEMVHQTIRSDHPFAAGTRIELVNRDHTECSLLPVKSVPPLDNERKDLGLWESLLH